MENGTNDDGRMTKCRCRRVKCLPAPDSMAKRDFLHFRIGIS